MDALPPAPTSKVTEVVSVARLGTAGFSGTQRLIPSGRGDYESGEGGKIV